MKIFRKLKEKWGIQSNWSLFFILVVFSVTGMSVVQINNMLSELFGFNEQTPLYIKILSRVLLIFPTYQILLLVWGFIFGQFGFFWEKQKKLGKWLVKMLGAKG